MAIESVSGSLVAAMVAWGRVNRRVYRDQAPSGATFPYITFFDLPSTAVLDGDGRVLAWNRQIQVSLWQQLKNEDRALVASLVSWLNGRQLTPPDQASIYSCRVNDTNRLPDPSPRVVQDALTLSVKHDGVSQ